MRKPPSYAVLAMHYPRGNQSDVRKKIGGGINMAWMDSENTCVIRVCYALNRAGHKIPRSPYGLTTSYGKNREQYLLRVPEFRTYLTREYGQPIEAANQTGIIIFGNFHADLWDGSTCHENCYGAVGNYPTYLWPC